MFTKRMVPILRFSEFKGAWDKKTLGDISFKINSGKTPLGGDKVYVDSGILFIRSQNVIENSLSYEKSTYITSEVNDTMKNSVVLPRDILLNITGASLGRSCVVPANFLIGNVNQHVCIIRLKNDNEPNFVQKIIASDKGQNALFSLQTGSGREGLNFQSIRSFTFYIPNLPEQQKIAGFLSDIDTKIEKLARKKELTGQFKKGIMQKLFSQEIRFKDDSGKEFPEWEEKQLGAITRKTDKKNLKGYDYPVYSINNKEGFVPQGDQFEGVDSGNRGYDITLYKIIGEKTFAYNPARINVGSIGYSYSLNNIIISSLYVCFKTSELVNDSFFLHYLKSYNFNKAVSRSVEGGVRAYLFYKNFAGIEFNMPSLPEQQKIAIFLTDLDTKITTIDRELSILKEFKRGLLQQMFV